MAWIHMIRIHMTWIHMILWIHIYNNIGAFSSDGNHHVKLLATILRWLHKHDFTINPLKCEWAIRETDWLGYLLTPQGLYLGKRWSMPYSTWINIDYCDMLPSWACILKPLTDQSSLTTYFMDRRNAKGICKMCLLMAANALAVCPDHNKWFSIHTNASDFQLGTCII